MNRWAVTMASGGKPLMFEGLLSFPTVASADGKFSIVCLSHQLRVYFLQTRQCIRTVDINLKDTISIFLDPENSHQVIAFSKKLVMYINWLDKVQTPVVATQVFDPPIKGVKEVFKITGSSYYALAEIAAACLIYKIDKETASATQVFDVPGVRQACMSSDGHQLAVVTEKNSIQLYDISASFDESTEVKSYAPVIANTKETFSFHGKSTCMAVSNSGVIAVGLALGAIHMVYGGSSTGQPQRTLRWHIDPVMCLTFSGDDVYLVSGGNEKVLVFWHLDLDRTQFLPRLSGPIDRVFVDKNRPDHYSVALRVYEGPQKLQSHEILTLLAVDLVSRLSVSPACPNVKNSVEILVKAARRSAKNKKSDSKVKALSKLLTLDLTAPMAVHPTSKHLYFARGSSIQAYDAIKGEQAFVQHAAPQISTGRVKSEHKMTDPIVSQVAFTPDGMWMATFDSMPTLNFDNLMLKNDTAYALKFWRLMDSTWALALKVVDPHGVGHEVGSIVSVSENSFTTIDTRGGIRVWKLKTSSSGPANSADAKKSTLKSVWTLRKTSPPMAAASAVSSCYSSDKSLLLVSHGSSVQVYHPESLHRIDFALPLMDLPVESLTSAGPYLIIASQRRIIVYDLVAAAETPLCVQISSPGAGNLCAVDNQNQIVALAINEINKDPISVKGRLLLFKPNLLEPFFSASHCVPITSLAYTPSGFIFIDAESRIGYVAPEARNHLVDGSEDGLTIQMNKVFDNAQAAANVLFARPLRENAQLDLAEDSSKWSTHKTIDVTLLQPIFTNTEGTSLESLFDRITRLVQ